MAAGIMLFAAGWIGGGDAKLFAVVCLWLGLDAMLNYAFFVCMIGGILAVIILALRRITLSTKLFAWPWVRRLAESRDGIPYGVALGAAALLVLPYTELFRMLVN